MPAGGALLLELTRSFPAPPARVFDFLADADLLVTWWGPRGVTIPRADFVPRVGARYRIEMQPPSGESFHLTGTFREVDPPNRLRYTFRWEEPDPDDRETLVELSLRTVDGGRTEVVLSHTGFATEARLRLHHDGWTESFQRLRSLVEPTD